MSYIKSTNPLWVDITGKRYNRLIVLGYTKDKYWECKCDCGNITKAKTGALNSGKKKSCGCLNKESWLKRITKHGGFKTPEYSVYRGMKRRCYNKNNRAYKHYGGRGIKVCDRWLESFSNFMEDMGKRPEKGTLDRIDVNGDYTKENCRWVDNKSQQRNKRDNLKVVYNNQEYLLLELCEQLNKDYTLVYERVYLLGWNLEDALHKPVAKKGITVIFQGEEIKLSDLSKKYSIPYDLLHQRIYRSKFTPEQAVFTPNRKKTGRVILSAKNNNS